MGKRQLLLAVLCGLSVIACAQQSDILAKSRPLSKAAITLLKQELVESDAHYDAEKKMTWTVTKEKHYHSDLDSGVRVHDTRASIQYAAALLHTEDVASRQRGIDIIRAILPLQEKDPQRAFCGVWPYYPEDPLPGRKAPVDYNWADFMSVSLIDIARNANAHLDKALQAQIKDALILAAHAIMKRDVKADYTNICIMGTYVCYVVGALYDQPDISAYGKHKLAYFYQYTKANKGFTEYNSPTYTVVAMDEVLRMKQVIINQADKQLVDELYTLCWQVIARHFHQPSGQWCGPYLRAYNDLLTPALKQLFFYASQGRINLPGDYPRQPSVLVPHEIPAGLVPAFVQQSLPGVRVDTFVAGRLQVPNRVVYADTTLGARDVTGKLYVHPQYALASANQGFLWNQCRPLMVHWGTPEQPSYLRLRFLHDGYDLSAACIKSVQDSSSLLSILNIATDGGDKHPNIDPIKHAMLPATDLRLRLETGGNTGAAAFTISSTDNNELLFTAGSLQMRIQVPYCNWDGLQGHWETGGDGNRKWADYVVYAGPGKVFDLAAMKAAVIGLSLHVLTPDSPAGRDSIVAVNDGKYLRLSRRGMAVKALQQPAEAFRIKNDFETDVK
ncbi:hypothetical protein [Chitinophaga parva]|uniref:hypothetical protein n=1 Tax=Chitinophaga parva TaxID=2169414 RepID=UPI0010575269|nr:hypothetical protein [Chitinophaga parva]